MAPSLLYQMTRGSGETRREGGRLGDRKEKGRVGDGKEGWGRGWRERGG